MAGARSHHSCGSLAHARPRAACVSSLPAPSTSSSSLYDHRGSRTAVGFNACKNVHDYILDKDVATTTLRFKVGDAVLAKTSPTEYALGTVKAIFHKEPQFPPGHVVPYQVVLESGSTVYVPADTDGFVKPVEKTAPDKVAVAADSVAALAVS